MSWFEVIGSLILEAVCFDVSYDDSNHTSCPRLDLGVSGCWTPFERPGQFPPHPLCLIVWSRLRWGFRDFSPYFFNPLFWLPTVFFVHFLSNLFSPTFLLPTVFWSVLWIITLKCVLPSSSHLRYLQPGQCVRGKPSLSSILFCVFVLGVSINHGTKLVLMGLISTHYLYHLYVMRLNRSVYPKKEGTLTHRFVCGYRILVWPARSWACSFSLLLWSLWLQETSIF